MNAMITNLLPRGKQAISLPNMSTIWETEYFGSQLPVDIRDDLLVVGIRDSKTVVKIDPSTGSKITNYTYSADSYINALGIDYFGDIVVGTSTGKVILLSNGTLSPLWEMSINSSSIFLNNIATYAGPSTRGGLLDTDNYSYVGSSYNINKIQLTSGSIVWSSRIHSGNIYSVICDDNGYVYSSGLDKTVRKTSPDGDQVWSFTGHTDYVFTVQVEKSGNVWSSSQDDTIKKINSSGTEILSITNPYPSSQYLNLLAIDNDDTYIYGSGNNNFYQINTDGSIVWSKDFLYSPRLARIKDNHLYISGSNYKLYKISLYKGILYYKLDNEMHPLCCKSVTKSGTDYIVDVFIP